ncbi:hypothetical protein [Algivirga pacifica]|uniref:Uncharacterized protein n=1 Tax=Algivirga pacifica TaxID=1162670 RepID=A0ABP9D340_9BACT
MKKLYFDLDIEIQNEQEKASVYSENGQIVVKTSERFLTKAGKPLMWLKRLRSEMKKRDISPVAQDVLVYVDEVLVAEKKGDKPFRVRVPQAVTVLGKSAKRRTKSYYEARKPWIIRVGLLSILFGVIAYLLCDLRKVREEE